MSNGNKGIASGEYSSGGSPSNVHESTASSGHPQTAGAKTGGVDGGSGGNASESGPWWKKWEMEKKVLATWVSGAGAAGYLSYLVLVANLKGQDGLVLAVQFVLSALIAIVVFFIGLFLTKGGEKRIMDKLDSMDTKLDKLDKLDSIEKILIEIRDNQNKGNIHVSVL